MFPVAFGSLWPNTVAQPSPNLAGFPALNRYLRKPFKPARFQRALPICLMPANRARAFFPYFLFDFASPKENTRRVSNLEDYYCDLAKWEKQPPIPLVHGWPKPLRNAVETDFVAATASCPIKNANRPVRSASTNQSIGNQVEEYTISKLRNHLSEFSIAPCKGAGYPDNTLIQKTTRLKMPLEFKASCDWNPNDANRRVLTSSSKKLRQQFSAPIHHLLLTVSYSSASPRHVTIKTLRLDFLEPFTAVNVRLEASVNHKILAHGPHHSRII